jgi:phosphate transport system protein
MSTLLINNQLERCGDIAVNIAQRVKKTGEYHSLIEESQIMEMGRHSRQMVKDAIDSFVNQNIEQAEKVLVTEEAVDTLNKSIFKFLISKMQSDPALVEPGAHLIVLTRNIERLADHATNIAEDLIFYVKAEIIAHKKKLERHHGGN